ncbi:MAG: cytochrome b/b6 domain-containing protein, partial [Selenomonadaceae bacterium]|nr:cytochrome b/b6 domain-containing protein [Selenomonadaceae bacterium]
MKSVKEVHRKEFYIFSPFLRIFHWIMASQIVILFATGLLITKPMNVAITEPVFSITSMDLVRDIHF